MTIKYTLLLAVLLAGWVPQACLGGLIGEQAPSVSVKEWIKGGPIAFNQDTNGMLPGTNIYVVEIWQTTSSACRAAITNFNEVQRRFKSSGVVVVGVSDEPADKIKAFVQHGAGTNIEYAIAADDQRQTSADYMRPLRQRGVPRAFVVGTNGMLLWYGHPFHGLDQVLARITTGQFDVAQAAKQDYLNHFVQEYLDMARRGDPRTRGVGNDVLYHLTNDVTLLCDLAFRIATDPQIAKRDFALADAALNQAAKFMPTNSARLGVNRAIVLFESGKHDDGLALVRKTLASAQSPEERTNVQSCLATMEAQLAALKAAPAKTNHVGSVPAPKRATAVSTNAPQVK